jgi:hypothetical protein
MGGGEAVSRGERSDVKGTDSLDVPFFQLS